MINFEIDCDMKKEMKISLKEVRTIIRKILKEHLLLEGKCPLCGEENAYVGLMNVECPNPECPAYSRAQEKLANPTKFRTTYTHEQLLDMQWNDTPIPDDVIDFVIDTNDEEGKYIVGRSNVSKQQAAKLAHSERGNLPRGWRLGALRGLASNQRHVRDYVDELLDSTLDPSDWGEAYATAVYTGLGGHVRKKALATGDKGIIRATDW